MLEPADSGEHPDQESLLHSQQAQARDIEADAAAPVHAAEAADLAPAPPPPAPAFGRWHLVIAGGVAALAAVGMVCFARAGPVAGGGHEVVHAAAARAHVATTIAPPGPAAGAGGEGASAHRARDAHTAPAPAATSTAEPRTTAPAAAATSTMEPTTTTPATNTTATTTPATTTTTTPAPTTTSATTATLATTAAPPPLAHKPPWECAWDGDACGQSRCCSRPGSQCFRKNATWSACSQSCAAGREMPGDRAGGGWSCEALSAPAPPLCSWEGENCAGSSCCRRVGFQCFEKQKNSARCGLTCEHARNNDTEPWSCRSLGGDVGVHLMPKSKTPAGTSLYCFTVVTEHGMASGGAPEGYEQALLRVMVEQKVGIFQCDGAGVFKGAPAKRGDWQSVANTDVFLHTWALVQKQGDYRYHDWTVKVDADAVFIPSRLRMHLVSLGPPKDTPVYLHNINFKFHFMGALEVLSAKAVDILLSHAEDCTRSFGLDGGEDYFTMQCLDASFVGHMTDFSLLDDKYSHGEGWNMFDITPCQNPAIVAFHPYKHANAWEGCYKVAMNIRQVEDFVGCDHRWHGDACAANSTREHLPTDSKDTKGIVG